MLLAAERAARVGGVDAHLGERQTNNARHDPLEPIRVLDRCPDRKAVTVRRSDEGVRLDREVGDHREVVGVLDDEIGRRRAHVAPGNGVLTKDVRVREWIVRTE